MRCWWSLVLCCGLAASEVYVAPNEIVTYGVTDFGMALFLFNQYDADRDGVLQFDECADLQRDTNPDLPLTRRDWNLLLRAFRTTEMRFEHLLQSYEEPWRSALGTDVVADFQKVFALTSRAIRSS